MRPGLGDLAAAELAAAIQALDDPLERVLDLAEFAALDLDDLRADLVIGRIDGGVDAVADDVHGGEFAIGVEVAIQGLTQRNRDGQPAASGAGAGNLCGAN